MRIVRIKSGLGNQMFQYAFYLNLKSLYKDTLADISTISKKNDHNGYELLDVFGVKLDVASEEQVEYYADDRMNLIDKVRRKTFGYKKTHYKEIEGLYDNKVWQKENALFDGYWQNEKYFLNVRDRVISTFTFKKELSQKNAILARKISESTSVSIHIRRGDYQKKENIKKFGSICTVDYYERGINYIENKLGDVQYFVFSDDINWCKKNISLKNAIFVDWNQKSESYVDMQLMSLCKHNILANSSFSWWGSYLNRNENKIVISPSKWFDDSSYNSYNIGLDEWVKL